MNDKHYIGGQWVTPMLTKTFNVINPANEEIITRVSAGNAEDIDAAVSAARLAFDEGPWPRLSGAERAKQSGIGRELGVWGLNNYLETKQITRFSSDEPWGWYIK